MTIGPRALKALTAAGTLAVCGASGFVVVNDPKPASAPLRPAVAQPAAASAASLTIPATCAGAGKQGAGTVDPALLPILQQLRAATTAQARRTILAGLTAAQRQQLTALMRGSQRSAGSSSPGTCSPAGASGAASGGTINPSVVDAPPSLAPLTNSYVS